ncbi:MAG: hypothetical protein LQ346_008110 [Caloplaca aetnensis]|nr:MAG: hypothetical protein LQ346_008110 [Caloplaca aetnensis]
MASSFFSPICDALVFGVNESDTRRRFKLLFLMLIYGHCYIVIYRSALAGQVYFDGTNTSPSFWYSVLGAMGAGVVFHLIDEGCCRLTRHDGPSEYRQERRDTDLEDQASNPASSPRGDSGHVSHKPLAQQPTPSPHNPIQDPTNEPAGSPPIPPGPTPPSKCSNPPYQPRRSMPQGPPLRAQKIPDQSRPAAIRPLHPIRRPGPTSGAGRDAPEGFQAARQGGQKADVHATEERVMQSIGHHRGAGTPSSRTRGGGGTSFDDWFEGRWEGDGDEFPI